MKHINAFQGACVVLRCVYFLFSVDWFLGNDLWKKLLNEGKKLLNELPYFIHFSSFSSFFSNLHPLLTFQVLLYKPSFFQLMIYHCLCSLLMKEKHIFNRTVFLWTKRRSKDLRISIESLFCLLHWEMIFITFYFDFYFLDFWKIITNITKSKYSFFKRIVSFWCSVWW